MTTRRLPASLLLFLFALGACEDRPAPLAPREHADFWDAVDTLDLEAALAFMKTPDERRYRAALADLLAGKPDKAREALCKIVKATDDDALRERAMALLSTIFRPGADFGDRSTFDMMFDCFGPAAAGTILSAHALFLPRDVIRLPDAPVSVPLQRNEFGLFTLPVTIDGQTFTFVLDTGFSYSAVSTSVAEACGILAFFEDRFPVVGATGATVEGQLGVVEELHIGDLVIENHIVLIMDDGDLSIGGMELSGVLGWPVFEELAVEIDALDERVTFRRSNVPVHRPPNLFWIGKPFVRVTARDGSALHFFLDTGANFSNVSSSLVPRLGLGELQQVTTELFAVGASAKIVASIVPDLRLHVGDVQIDLSKIVAHDLLKDDLLVRFDGRFGADIMEMSRVLIDFPAGRFDFTLPTGGP